MDKKLIIICLTTGSITSLIIWGLSLTGIFLFTLLGIILVPGLLFGIVLTTYFKKPTFRYKIIFTIICFVIYFFSSFITFNLDTATNGLTLIFFSTLTLPLITLMFDSIIGKLKNLKKSLTIALTGGFIAGLLVFALTYYFKTNNTIELTQYDIKPTELLIFPIWQAAFALTIE